MRILLYGETYEWGFGAWCYAETLRDMGHEVFEFEKTAGLEAYRRGLLWRGIRRVLGAPLRRHLARHNALLVARAERVRPDIVVILKGLHVSGGSVAAMRALGAWVVNLNHDDFFSGNGHNWSPLQRAALPAYDFVFVTRRVNVEEVGRHNPRVAFFPFSYYPRIHRQGLRVPPESGAYACDVLFVGTWEEERCRLMEGLVRRLDASYAVYGSLWGRAGRSSVLAPFIKGRDLGPAEMAEAFRASKISLGFLRKKNRDEYTQRTFEIPACGGVFLGERTPEHSRIFRDGVDALLFDAASLDDLVDKAGLLLRDAAMRERMRAAGAKAVADGPYTYRDRLGLLFGRYEEWRRSGGRGGG